MNEFGCRLKIARLAKEYTQEELAEMLGVSQTTYSDWEIGKSTPKADISVKLAEIFGLDCLLLIIGITDEILIEFYENVMINFSKNLIKIREQRNLTQKDLAKIIGVTKQTIINYEKGLIKPSFEKIEKIALCLEVRVYDLLLI